jgi:hypothetical protein
MIDSRPSRTVTVGPTRVLTVRTSDSHFEFQGLRLSIVADHLDVISSPATTSLTTTSRLT